MNCDGCPDRGMCCRYIELPLARRLTSDETRWAELHEGIRIKGSVVRIEQTCSALSADGLCTLYGTPDRPEMCARWPDRPEVQAPLGCVYLEGVK